MESVRPLSRILGYYLARYIETKRQNLSLMKMLIMKKYRCKSGRSKEILQKFTIKLSFLLNPPQPELQNFYATHGQSQIS